MTSRARYCGMVVPPPASWSPKNVLMVTGEAIRPWGKPTQAVEASVNIFDQMTDDEQKAMLAALQALKGD